MFRIIRWDNNQGRGNDLARRERKLEWLLIVMEPASGCWRSRKPWVSQGGAPNLKARSIAEKAGIAVGSVYNLFGDLDRLHGQVNMRLLDRLSDAGTRAMAEMQEKGVRDTRLRSLALARAYLQFVQEQPQSWAALLAFNPRRAGPAAAVAFERRLDALFDIIAEVLAQDAKLDLDGQQAKLTARVLWSSVHGIVVNGVRRRQQDRHGQGVWGSDRSSGD